jgi:hypothetical protein
MGLANSFGGVVSPILGKIADTNGLPLVMWIIVGVAALACAGSFFITDPKEFTQEEN